MNHLTVEEIIDFVSLDAPGASAALVSRVNGHLLECADCREKTAAFLTLRDELTGIAAADRAAEEQLNPNETDRGMGR